MAEIPHAKPKTIRIFILTIILGFVLFALPNLFFGITKFNGGLMGVNLLLIAVFQFISVIYLIKFSLKLLKIDFAYIGLSAVNWKRDVLLGLVVGLAWAAIQFGLVIPNTGGAEREDISQMTAMMDGTLLSTFSFLALGVIGGGITEEIYNRGYFINVLRSTFKNSKVGVWVAALLSIVFFALGHLPSDALSWFDILVPTVAYTLLFLTTRRLTAPMVAHGIYNMTAILLTYYLYYQ